MPSRALALVEKWLPQAWVETQAHLFEMERLVDKAEDLNAEITYRTAVAEAEDLLDDLERLADRLGVELDGARLSAVPGRTRPENSASATDAPC